jgi:hypothetical protein
MAVATSAVQLAMNNRRGSVVLRLRLRVIW